MLGLRYRIDHIPRYRLPPLIKAPNRPGTLRPTPDHIPERDTTHDTANGNAGANARMHAQYVRAPNWGGRDKTSYHHVVDDQECIELLPWEEAAYHGGTPASNLLWMGVELCVNRDGDWGRTVDNGAKLAAVKMVKFGKTREWMVQHNASYGKDCPARLRHTPGAWEHYVAESDRYSGALRSILAASHNPSVPREWRYEPTGVTVIGGILDYFDQNGGIARFGVPIWPEQSGDVMPWSMLPELRGFTVQLFDKDALAWRSDVGTVVVRTGAVLSELVRYSREHGLEI